MVHLKVGVKLETGDKVPVTNSAHDRNDFNGQALIFDLKIVSYERVILKSNCDHLSICAYVEAQWLSVMILSLKRQRHL